VHIHPNFSLDSLDVSTLAVALGNLTCSVWRVRVFTLLGPQATTRSLCVAQSFLKLCCLKFELIFRLKKHTIASLRGVSVVPVCGPW
jgi:hypothetical protein